MPFTGTWGSETLMLDTQRKLFFQLQRLLARLGLEVRYVGKIPPETPDRECYRPRFEPWHDARWSALLRAGDPTSLVTLDRRYVLAALLRQALASVEGDVIECGVYRGGTARLFADLLKTSGSSKTLHLFDTFAGIPERTSGQDVHAVGDFSDTSIDGVRARLSDFPAAKFHPGYIPDTFAELPNGSFCFAHVDVDQYETTREATRYVYPRLNPGGFLVFDDYGFASCPGVRNAVDTEFADKPEMPLVLSTGQCVVFKGLHG
jgi:O-methyltransferase